MDIGISAEYTERIVNLERIMMTFKGGAVRFLGMQKESFLVTFVLYTTVYCLSRV
jgi:hypothetical protein